MDAADLVTVKRAVTLVDGLASSPTPARSPLPSFRGCAS